MAIAITEELKGKEFYFDMRPSGIGEEEGFWATPIFESDRSSLEHTYRAHGGGEGLWIELLVRSISRWEGIKDVFGKDISCTAENIRKLCNSDAKLMTGMLSRISDAANYGVLVASKN